MKPDEAIKIVSEVLENSVTCNGPQRDILRKAISTLAMLIPNIKNQMEPSKPKGAEDVIE